MADENNKFPGEEPEETAAPAGAGEEAPSLDEEREGGPTPAPAFESQ